MEMISLELDFHRSNKMKDADVPRFRGEIPSSPFMEGKLGEIFQSATRNNFVSRVYLEEEVVFHHFTEDVSDENVGLLDAGRAGGRNDKREISHFPDDTAVIPVSAIVLIPISFATSKALTTFGEFPLVVMPIATSLSLPRALICFAKISLKAKSLETLVRTEASVVRAIAGNGGRSMT